MDNKMIEKKWQKIWNDEKVFLAHTNCARKKFYALVEFPYPSGVGLHMGHLKAYSSLEILSRMKRLQGYNVLFPIGWDAFGLPTENFAIKHNIPPRVATDNNIATLKNALINAGFSFDWSRTVDTTDPNFYKWTQWIFIQMFKRGLAYKSKAFVNYCPNCDVILSNEESQNGVCDRCHTEVVQREKNVWFLKIRDYADRLLSGLDKLNFPDRIKEEQRNWIGKSTGAEINFKVKSKSTKTDNLKVYTTRADTLFGATFMVVAPEHPLIDKFKNDIENLGEIENYQTQAKKKSEFDRIQVNKDKTGVQIKGVNAINPVTNKEIPIFIADYVMMGYGTGAIMAVPAHDTRDWEFAKKFNLPIIPVIKGGDVEKEAYTDIYSGTMINSDFLNNLPVKQAIERMIEFVKQNNLGNAKTNYQMKDWAFNRQRYWGEPFPIIYCPKCGIVTVPESELPLKLPEIKNFKPSKNGESPLAEITDWVNCTCPQCGAKATRETDTMPQWAGSSWYYLRYMDPQNNTCLADKDAIKYWGPIDWYNGGMEHVTRHLIYARFWNMFLYDIGITPFEEPFSKRTAQGLVLGEDGNKMSKSLGNVVDPADIQNKYGADVLRLYVLFMADYGSAAPWSSNNISGCERFLKRVEKLKDFVDKYDGVHANHAGLVNDTITKVTEDIESQKYNTAISALMSFVNAIFDDKNLSKQEYITLLTLLYPFAPHTAEELNQQIGNPQFLCKSSWPTLVKDNSVKIVNLPIQINGKVRGIIEIEQNSTQAQVEDKIKQNEKLQNYLKSAQIVKIIFVQNKIMNIIIK